MAASPKIPQTMFGNCVQCLLLTVVYVVSGKLGLMLALPPGYASPIFPPAGIAVAAALIGGKRTLPWIFIGSLLLNIWVGYSASQHINSIEFVAATAIALASMLQAAIGGWLLRRVIGYPTGFVHGPEILRFLLLAPAICLTSATLSVGSLWALGSIDAGGIAANWASWWVGDTLGVVVMLPIVMTVAGQPRELWRSRMLTVAVPMLLIFALFVVIFLKTSRWEYENSLSDFRQYSQQTFNQVQAKLEEQGTLLDEMAGLFVHDATGHVTRAEFHRFVQKGLKRFPMIQALEWAPRVDAAHRQSFEAGQRGDVANFEIREQSAAGSMVRAGERAMYYPVTYIEPFTRNEPAVGFDLASNSARGKAITEAIQSESEVTTEAVHLVQDSQPQAGVLIMLAIRPHDNKSGVALTVLRMSDFMNALLSDMRPMLYTRLIDLDEQKILYDDFIPESGRALHKRAFIFGTRHYQLETAPTPAYFKQHSGWQSFAVLAIGICGTGLLGALLLLGTGYTAHIEAQVEDRTRRLKESEEGLNVAQRVGQIGSWDWDAATDTVTCSEESYRVLGLDPNKPLPSYEGHLKLYTAESATRLDMAVKRSVQSGEPYELDLELLPVNGVRRWVTARSKVKRDARGQFAGLGGTTQDITARKNAEQAIKRSKDQFEAILNATTESIFHVDKNGVILAVNAIAAHRVQKEPQDMIGRNAFDFFPPEVSAKRREYLEDVFRTGQEKHTEDMRDNHFFSLNFYPIVGNDGAVDSVVVYAADITESHISQLRMERLLAEQKAILENDLVGIVTVKDRKIVWANPAFEKILGYDSGELVGTSTRLNYPSEDAYQAFGAAAYPVLAAGKVYRSQIEHVRKDGTHIWVDVNGAMLDPATGESLWGFIDITERKHAEEALREQKNFLSTILENEPECVKVVGADGKLLQMNPAGLSMLEVSGVDEVNAYGLSDFVISEHRAAFSDLFRRVLRGETGLLEYEVQGRKGTLRWLETHAAPLRNADGEIKYALGVTRDVTRRREAEERLALSLRGSNLALTDWHIPSDRLTFGEGWMNLLGYQPAELSPLSSTLAGLIRQEDAMAARDSMIRHFKGATPFFEAEVRMRHKDGRWVWIQARGMAVERDSDGRATRVAGTAMDISERKRAEAEIARLSQWNEMLLNSAGEGIYGVDLNGCCTFINPAALAILGYAKEAVLGKNQHVIFHHHHKDGSVYPQDECPVHKTIHDGIRREVEDMFIRKNGDVFPVQLTVTPMHENGQIVGVEVVFQDIARRKEMEQELTRLATTDPLTGVANRRHFLEQLEMEHAHFKRFGKPSAFLMIDIDYFKNVNDTYGHAIGDAVLQHLAELSKLQLRRIDLFGRLGGEEFGIILPGTDPAGALQFAERFRSDVADNPARHADTTVPFTISIGIAEFDPGDVATDSILARADAALYRAKKCGRNRVEVN